ncbi:MAG: peptidylprolyl isomerase, partial [Xanthomonadales bacterium]|nr:peptidylprolyl isomerase [Xanthomonadales bacterium]
MAQAPADKANPRVEIYTSEGNIVAELYADKAPKSVENFLAYVKSGQYNGTIFHRVIDGF